MAICHTFMSLKFQDLQATASPYKGREHYANLIVSSMHEIKIASMG